MEGRRWGLGQHTLYVKHLQALLGSEPSPSPTSVRHLRALWGRLCPFNPPLPPFRVFMRPFRGCANWPDFSSLCLHICQSLGFRSRCRAICAAAYLLLKPPTFCDSHTPLVPAARRLLQLRVSCPSHTPAPAMHPRSSHMRPVPGHTRRGSGVHNGFD